jgi:hypothetical protein
MERWCGFCETFDFLQRSARVLECTVDGIDVLLRFMVDGPKIRVEGENCVVRLGRCEEARLCDPWWRSFVVSSSSSFLTIT